VKRDDCVRAREKNRETLLATDSFFQSEGKKALSALNGCSNAIDDQPDPFRSNPDGSGVRFDGRTSRPAARGAVAGIATARLSIREKNSKMPTFPSPVPRIIGYLELPPSVRADFGRKKDALDELAANRRPRASSPEGARYSSPESTPVTGRFNQPACRDLASIATSQTSKAPRLPGVAGVHDFENLGSGVCRNRN